MHSLKRKKLFFDFQNLKSVTDFEEESSASPKMKIPVVNLITEFNTGKDNMCTKLKDIYIYNTHYDLE